MCHVAGDKKAKTVSAAPVTCHSSLVTSTWCPRSDLHRHCARFKCAVSALDYVGKFEIGAA